MLRTQVALNWKTVPCFLAYHKSNYTYKINFPVFKVNSEFFSKSHTNEIGDNFLILSPSSKDERHVSTRKCTFRVTIGRVPGAERSIPVNNNFLTWGCCTPEQRTKRNESCSRSVPAQWRPSPLFSWRVFARRPVSGFGSGRARRVINHPLVTPIIPGYVQDVSRPSITTPLY